jgi:hypothetical protein
MALVGPIGRDLGIFFIFPMLCAVAHAMNGDHQAACNILDDTIDDVWDNYSKTLKEEGK